ncbi:MAG: 3-deoxy-manno-octulosonate cytidylyltransferase [Armatimonadota bacterium]|nr:3-deoxy-manno-octulosonate cytidylyltransferase [Armatimonadota bacterium]
MNDQSLKIMGVIPARLNSSRLPGKVLREIAGQPMLHWVYENARNSPQLTDLVVATDSEEVRQFCENDGIPVTMTGEHPSGGDRLHEVMGRTDADIYVNIQGDEPTLRPDHLELLLQPFFNGSGVQVTTLKVAVERKAALDPNNVKVVTARDGKALYFSRYPIPYDRDGLGDVQHFKHIGLYAYTREALGLFHSWPQSPLELHEKLEQLRYLQNGVPIHVVETPHDTVGVDTEADLQRVIEMFDAL